MSEGKRPERAPWDDFPPVIRNGDLKELEREPEYQAAKAGDQSAALDMAERLVRPETVEAIREVVGDRPAKIVPVLARKAGGNNKIPLATAEVLGDRLGLEVEYNIVQAEKVGRTNKGADKFALEQIPDKDNRDRFLEGVRDRIADNLEHGRENTAPRILDDRSQGHDDQER